MQHKRSRCNNDTIMPRDELDELPRSGWVGQIGSSLPAEQYGCVCLGNLRCCNKFMRRGRGDASEGEEEANDVCVF